MAESDSTTTPPSGDTVAQLLADLQQAGNQAFLHTRPSWRMPDDPPQIWETDIDYSYEWAREAAHCARQLFPWLRDEDGLPAAWPHACSSCGGFGGHESGCPGNSCECHPRADDRSRCLRVADGLEMALTFVERPLLDTAIRQSIKELRSSVASPVLFRKLRDLFAMRDKFDAHWTSDPNCVGARFVQGQIKTIELEIRALVEADASPTYS